MNEVSRGGNSFTDFSGSVSARSRVVEQLTPADIFQKLWRQKAWIFGTIFVVTFFSWIVIQQLTPLYMATSQVMLGSREEKVIDLDTILSGLTLDSLTIESETHVLRSRGIVGNTVDKLNLNHDPEFNPALRSPSLLRNYLRANLPESWHSYLFAQSEKRTLTREEREAVDREIVIDEFLKRLEVIPESNSLVIKIAFTSREPRTAQAAVNTLTDFYIVSQLDAKLSAAKQASTWLADRLSQLRAEARASAAAVEAFRKESGLLQVDGTATLAEQEISQLNLRLVEEQTNLAEIQARLRQVDNLLQSPDGVESASEVLNSPLIINLRQQEAELEREAAELAEVYGDRHPEMVNRRAELKDFRQKIRSEVNKVVQGLRNEVSIARSRVRSLEAVMDQRRQTLAEMNAGEVELQALQREADASQNLLEIVLARFKEISAQQDFQKADATILARAGMPRNPSFPDKSLMLTLAALCSIFLGVLIAFAVDQSDSGLRSMEQIEQFMNTAPLGLIPALNEIGHLGKEPGKFILEQPNSAYSESIRSLYTNLAYRKLDNPLKTLLVTSSVPKEGKTSISVSLARALANHGQNVLLLDCDFRRGTAHKAFGLSPTPGLIEYLDGNATLEEVLQRDPDTGAHFIPMGMHSSKPLSFQAYKKLQDLLVELADEERYDLVILDSAPILAVSDTRMLSQLVDSTVLVVRWAKTRRTLIKRAIKQIMGAGCEVGGIVLSRVDVKRHSQYGYGDSGFYTGSMGRYYTK